MNEYFPDGKNEILVTFMFRGKYAVNMLGHEIINIFKADNGKHYIYVNPYGRVSKTHAQNIGTILLARHINNSRIEIIAKAWGLKLSPRAIKSRPKKLNDKNRGTIKKEREKHREECKDIKYGGKLIEDVFKDDKDPRESLITYEVEYFRRTKKPLYISYSKGNDCSIKMEGQMPRQTLLKYYSSADIDYEKIGKIIEDNDNWEIEDTSKKVDPKSDEDNSLNFLKVIGKEDDELAFSNWLAFYLKNYDILDKFASDKNLLNLQEHIGRNYKLYREEKNIDLLIEDIANRRYIVIENKIKSGINGRQVNDEQEDENHTQLKKYVDEAKKLSEGHNHNHNQKDVFWNPEDNKFFIFTPNYSDSFAKEKNKYGYTEIKYSAIFEFFLSIARDKKCPYPLVHHFIIALSRQKGEYPDEIFEDTRRKFVEKIKA